LRRGRRGARRETQDGADQQPAGPENSFLHKRFPFRESHARPQPALANSIGNEDGTVAAATPQLVGKIAAFAA
jgi:hypothetical protein